MSRYADYAASTDPLQRRRPAAAATVRQPASPHALHDGLIAIAPRLALVFLIAGAVQMLMHWFGR